MEEKCGSAAICFVAFLPDILDSKAEGRNKYLEMMLSVAEKFKRSPYRHVDNNDVVTVFFFNFLLLFVHASKALKNAFGWKILTE